jgi:hypothetical protein
MSNSSIFSEIPIMASNVEEESKLNPVARIILQGLYDTGSPFHLLAGMHYILKAIWHDVLTYHKSRIKKGDNYNLNFVKVKWGHFYSESDSHSDWLVRFPEPEDININMMPFVMAKRFNETKLPDYLRTYWDQILAQCIVSSELGKIGYLTIHESYVEKGSTQRTPGIHTESPGVVMFKGSKGKLSYTSRFFRWGHGVVSTKQELEGGIYMASNVPNSCKVWNCNILPPDDNSPDVVGEHGDIEHLRAFLPSSCEVMDANTVYWLTDRTPHEALPLSKGTYRQFVRVVTSQLTYWHEEHNTKNPFGVVPDPNITKIIKGSKFDGSCYIVDP